MSADTADWIAAVVRSRCVNARLVLDPFHIVARATDALDEVRREVWNAARRSGATAHAKQLKGARFALWKNPEPGWADALRVAYSVLPYDRLLSVDERVES